MFFWKFFYNVVLVPLLWFAFRCIGIVNRKVRRGIQGRHQLFQKLEKEIATLSSSRRLWFHASSLGEFEQAKPIIAALKKSDPSIEIIVTFFSPSGFDNSRNYTLASILSYIPFDSYLQTEKFIAMVRPTGAIMVRYDIWPNMIWALHRHAVPTFIANATMKMNSSRKLPIIRQFHRVIYNCFTRIFTVSEDDRKSFSAFGITVPDITAIGDTRYDQVIMRSRDARLKHVLPPSLSDGKKIFIVGQSWPEDEAVIIPVLKKLYEQEQNLLTILVPHEPTEEHLDLIENQIGGSLSHRRFSEIHQYRNEQVVIIDSIGVLVALYQYAHIVYVGGSFRQGVHNVLEPAVFGVPVLFGPKHTNSQEAIALSEAGGAFVVDDEKTLYRTLRILFDDDSARSEAGVKAKNFVELHAGATERFLHALKDMVPS